MFADAASLLAYLTSIWTKQAVGVRGSGGHREKARVDFDTSTSLNPCGCFLSAC